MSLLKIIIDEMYTSMKSGDKDKADTLRTLIAKLKDQQIKLRKDISDEEALKIIKTLVKQKEKNLLKFIQKQDEKNLLKKKNLKSVF